MTPQKLKQYVLPLVVCLGLVFVGAYVGSSNPQAVDRLTSFVPFERAEPEPVAAPVEEAIPFDQLPESYWAWHLTLFLHQNWEQLPNERAIVEAFTVDPRLAKLKKQVHNKIITPDVPMFEKRFFRSATNPDGPIARIPAVMIQNSTGWTVYKCGSTEPVPNTPCQLGNDIAQMINAGCPWPRPKPKPEPEPAPKPDVNPMPIPDITPNVAPDVAPAEEEEEEASDGKIIGYCIVVFLSVLAGTYYVQMKKNIREG